MSYPPQGSDNTTLLSNLAVVDANVDTLLTNVATVDTVVDAIRVVTDATPVMEETGGTITSDAEEQTVYINNAPEGVYEPNYVSIDFTNNTAAQSAVIRLYRRYKDGGDWIMIDQSDPIVGLPAFPGIDIELKANRYGSKVTLQVIGAAKTYDWTAFYKATS